MIALNGLDPPTRIADTIMVMIPIGPDASNKWSAHPVDLDKNCFVASSPKSVKSGKTAVPTLLKRSVKSFTGWVAVGRGVVFVGVADAIIS